jgi:hypothetical protein
LDARYKTFIGKPNKLVKIKYSKKSLEVWIIFPYLCFEILKRRGGLVVNLVLCI